MSVKFTLLDGMWFEADLRFENGQVESLQGYVSSVFGPAKYSDIRPSATTKWVLRRGASLIDPFSAKMRLF